MNARTLDRAPLPAPSGARPTPAPEGLPLTAAQSGMWFAQALDAGSPALNTAECIEIHGDVDPALFADALHRTVGEADALRVRIADTADGPRQSPIAVEPPGHGFPLYAADLRDQGDPEGTARAWMRADAAEPFDLATGPLFAHGLFRVGDHRWLWYQRVHHAVLDGYGYSLVARRVAEVYSALAAGTDPGPSPFGRLAALVEEDAAYRDSPARGRDRAHWLAGFADRPEAPTLAGRTALPSRTSVRSTAHLAPERTDRLRRLAASVRATWTDVLFATQALYLARATRSEEVVLGLPMMGRMGSVALRVPGMVMNVLPLRLTVTADTTFAELTRQVVLGIRAARRHQRYRYEDIRRDLGLLGEGRALVGPLVNVMPFDYGLTFAGARSDAHNIASGPVDDLTVNIYDRADGSGLRVDYDGNPALYRQDELAAHQDRFLDLLARIADRDPHLPLGGLALATDAECARVLTEFNDTAVELPPTTLIGPIEARAARTPGATALVSGPETLSYAELNARANRLARHLTALGVRPGALAAVALPRSTDLVVALLAVLKAGGAYLPLDTAHPAARLTAVLDAARPVCVLTDLAGRAALPAPSARGTTPAVVALDDPALREELAALLPTDPGRALTPQHPAYVLHTSGSTGTPKGVVVPHSAIDNRLRWMQDRYRLAPGDRVLQKTPTGFDVSVWEFFWPLREGATLVVAGPDDHRDPARLARTVREQGVTAVHFVPSMLRLFLAEPGAAACTGLRHVFSSGEALPRDTADAFHRLLPGTALHNLYGPTEAAVDVTHHTCEPGETGPVPIGRPVWNTRLYILDTAGRPCPPGVPGELHLAGAQLATGYLGRPDLTAERFVHDPYGPPGARMYRTGDLARWREDGSVEYLGRTDRQVKVRGQRVELDGIEAVLATHEHVAAACALVREDRPGDPRLVAYVTPASADAAAEAGGPDPAALRAHVAARLPEAMVPTAVVVLDAFPAGPNGKLDHAALPAPGTAATSGGREPRDAREEALTRLFAEALGLPHVGVDDSFFELGGNSLLAARLAARVRDVLGADLPMGTLFQAATPAAVADRMHADGTADEAALGPVLPLRPAGAGTPLFALHPAAGLGWCYTALLTHLAPDQPLYGLQAPGLRPGDAPPEPYASLEEMAAAYAERIRGIRPHGPYRLLGWSAGGVLAHAVAVLLQEAGERVELLAMMDGYPSGQWRERLGTVEADALAALLETAGCAAGETPLTREAVTTRLGAADSAFATLPAATLAAVVDTAVRTTALTRGHRHRVFDGDVLFFTAAAPRAETWLTRDAWRPYVTGNLINRDIDCAHADMTRPGPAAEVARAVTAHLGEKSG
ncbi:amino acid adenylation domain-containing protein [Streptomyces eurocidicus]|uniref:Enterobactin synthetase component F n=1 Tax=Streptomyces eurocidicus TaxID=66423 RepID=A0A7W8F569_STREU|nr:enterobactin synthetase component F [Streptomyces eurocidicus]